ncbi:alpha/beta fold hydrolase [Nocardia shimofusensis]|uniref:alpha/beta fold hydrolase n=1 Tax=Nocardia shimofusensis TaxID=228596 RepID=UPI000B2B8E0A|nr:alpha/beta hydrolase [Nocardia shimofusensis]
MNINHTPSDTMILEVEGGQLAYDVAGGGPLFVLVPGMGENRSSFRAVADRLVAAGHRVAAMDMRGHGESSLGWDSYTRTDVAADILALIRHLGGPAVVVGHSFAGGAATIAAAQAPELVEAVVEIGPFTRRQQPDLRALLTDSRYRKGMLLLAGAAGLRSVGLWKRYLDHATPGTKPAGFDERLAAADADLRRPGRMAVLSKFGSAAPTDAGDELAGIGCPALVLMGTLDPDWADPKAEGEGIVSEMPTGLGRLEMVEGAGHYPHVQFPERVAASILAFVADSARG